MFSLISNLPNDSAVANLRRLAIGLSMLLSVCSADYSFAKVDLDDMSFDIDKTYLVKMNDGKRYAGRIYKGYESLKVLRRNGRVTYASEKDIASIDKVADEFVPKTSNQLRVELQNEFGGKYTVSVTKHFLVVHPIGKYEEWAWPMEQVYMRFETYCMSRGIETSEPEFPMVAVILRTKREFQRIARSKKTKSAAGYYSLRSNRCFTYVQKYAWMSEAECRKFTFETMMHEAAHQIAYNTGLHDRFNYAQRWYAEGLGMLFEAKGVNDLMKHPKLEDRINWEALETYRKFRKSGRSEGVVENLLSVHGRMFDQDVYNAYASAWALTFYLTERRPREYAKYVAMHNPDLSSRPKVETSPVHLLVRFAGTPDAIEAGMNSFIDSLPKKK